MQEEKPDVFPSSDPSGDNKMSKIEQMNALMRKNRELKQNPVETTKPEIEQHQFSEEPKIPQHLVEPDFDSDFDVIPIPSKGVLYNPRITSLKVSYMNGGDENILSNPNLLKTGKFLEVLMRRKILHSSISYKDLLIGDRDAVMIWLRSTGYGNMYPISLIDPSTGDEFETEFDLNEIKFKELTAEPDDEGLFDYELSNGKNLKFKLFTVGDMVEIEEYAEKIDDSDNYDLATYTLARQIIEVDGNRDKEFINGFVAKMRILESKNLKKYISDIEPKMDSNIKVRTPGGVLLDTFFPLNPSFFWPKL
jgi:hypothetical protein